MSFSEQIKDEILLNKNKRCCEIALRYGELITESNDLTLKEIKSKVINLCCKKSFLRGAFLGSGCIIDPNKDYHFEIIVKSKAYANYIIELTNDFSITPKIVKRDKNYIVYLKDCDSIENILRVLGASKSFLYYEDIRINKSLKNDINRTVNCETANLNKTIEASVKQIAAINSLKNSGKLYNLNDKLVEIAKLRIQFPDVSLEELATKCKQKTSKSGVYHRLNKIVKLAEEK